MADTPPAPSEDRCFFDVASRVVPGAPERSLHVAIVGASPQVVLDGFERTPAAHVALVHAPADLATARRLRDTFCEAGVPTRLHRTQGDAYLGTLQALSSLLQEARLAYEDVVVNVGSGSSAAGCAATTAAFLHGVRAVQATETLELRALPVLPVGQRDFLRDTDVAVLVALARSPRGLASLARTAGVRRDLVEARLAGEPDRKGLLALGLVEEARVLGLWPRWRLSAAGRALYDSGAITGETTV